MIHTRIMLLSNAIAKRSQRLLERKSLDDQLPTLKPRSKERERIIVEKKISNLDKEIQKDNSEIKKLEIEDAEK